MLSKNHMPDLSSIHKAQTHRGVWAIRGIAGGKGGGVSAVRKNRAGTTDHGRNMDGETLITTPNRKTNPSRTTHAISGLGHIGTILLYVSDLDHSDKRSACNLRKGNLTRYDKLDVVFISFIMLHSF